MIGRAALGRWTLSPTSRLTRAGRARRRFNCARQNEWDERAERALDLLSNHRECAPEGGTAIAIADFGAGNERLRGLLEERLRLELDYFPYDLHPQLSTTARLDLAREVPDRQFDVVVCLGLLEYLPSVPELARSLRDLCRCALVSYVTSDGLVAMPHAQRLEHGWTTHLAAAEVESAFGDAGFRQLGKAEAESGITTIWLWQNARVEPAR